MKEYPLISVIVPTVGRETLERALESIVNSKYPKLQILVSANSVDLLPITCRLSYPDTKLVWWNHEAVFPAKAKNEALKVAIGKYVTFLDDDDTALPTKFFELVYHLENNPDVFAVFGQYNVRDCYTNEIKHTGCGGHEYPSLKSLLANNYIASGSIMLRNTREVYFDESLPHGWGEDYDLWLRLLGEGYKFKHISIPVYCWTQNLKEGFTATFKKVGIKWQHLTREIKENAKRKYL